MAELKKDKAPLFYQLTNKEWVETVKDLTGAEIKVLYHVRSLDPFGDRELDYSVTQVALQLGLSKGAVSKAFKKLDQMNLICVELVRVKVRVNTNKNNITEFPKENSVSYRKHKLPIRNENFSEETEVSSSKRSFPIGNEQPLEPLQHKDSSIPQTIQTYTDFKKTLSEEERANFLNFCQEKIKNLSQEVNDIEAWLAHQTKAGRNRWEVYYEKYLASKQKSAKKAEAKNTLSQFRTEIEQQQRQVEKAWFESQHQNSTSNTGGVA
jgi:predicted transcriptional regulator